MPYHCRSLSSNRPYYKRLDCRKKTGKDKVFYGYGFSPRAKHKREHILLVDYGMPTISRLFKKLGLFAEYSLFYRALLQKRPVILRSLLTEATP